jgi:hypothetical protein
METNNQTMQITADTLPSNIVLYGKPDVGKTSTLQLLIILLCGGGKLDPAVCQAFEKAFLKYDNNGNPYYHDVKVVTSYRDTTIYISTMGDTWANIRANLDFFKNDWRYKDVYHYGSNGFVKYDKDKLKKERMPKGQILVSAVRDDDSQTGSMHAMRILNATRMSDWQRELWVHKIECSKNGEPLEGFSFTKPFLKSDYDLAVKMVKYIDQIIYGDTI